MKKIGIMLLFSIGMFMLVACSEEQLPKQEIEIQLSFVSNGGTDTESIVTNYNAVQLPEDPTKEGYTFGGWFWDNHSFKIPFTVESLSLVPLTGDMTLYAKWIEQTPVDQSAPVFEGVEDVVIDLHASFDPLEGVTANDDVDGDLTQSITYSGDVDVTIAGTYIIFYRVEDSSGNLREEERYVTVEFDLVLPNEEITITLWHAFGGANQALLEEIFEDFNQLYPNITIHQVSQGGYASLRNATINAITSGNTPTMVMGYTDHFMEYIAGNALVGLNRYIHHEDFGVNLDDFVPGFLAESQQYLDGIMYSLPYAKTSEMVVYNKTVFDYHGITIPNDVPLTWTDLEGFADTIIGSGDMQCEFLFNADSAANFFINSSRQWDAGYTTTEGDILINNSRTREMLQYFEALMHQNILAFPIEWDEDYGSTNFRQGDVCMTQGSTAGVRYNIPFEGENGKFGQFEVGITPVIQLEDGTPSAIQQGPNIAILSNASEVERLAAWLLMQYMTNTENTAYFAMNTGYIPVRLSAFNDPDYQAFLNTDDPDRLSYAMTANVAYEQVNLYQYDPAFVGRITSSIVRQEAGYLVGRIYTGTQTIEESLQQMLDNLGQ